MNPGGDWGYSGGSIAEAAKRAAEEADKRRNTTHAPWRFRLQPGEEAEIIILDESLDKVRAIWEHNLKIDGKFGNFESCCAEFAPCPVCKHYPDSPRYFVMFLTILDLRPYTNKKTGEVVPFTRRLLAVKSALISKFEQIERAAKKINGTFRGTYMVLKRGTGGKDANTGEPSLLENGSVFDGTTEEQLIADYGHPAIKDRDGKVIIPANGKLEPYDYVELFPRPDPDEVAERLGLESAAGSRRANRAELEEPAAPAPARRRAPAPAEEAPAPVSRRRAVAPEPEDDIPMNHAGDAEREAPAPTGGVRRPVARRAPAPAADDDGENPFE